MRRLPSGLGEQPLVLAASVEPLPEPRRDRDERERGDDDREGEHDHALPEEDVDRLVERPVEPGRHRDAPSASGVTTVSSIVDIRASAFVAAMSAAQLAELALEPLPPRASRTARVSASSDSVASRAVMRAIWARSELSRRSRASRLACRSSIVTSCETMRPSAESRAIACCTFATGTRRVIVALPCSPVATDALTTCPPSERVRSSASCAARETSSGSATSTVRVALTRCARSGVGPIAES